MPYYLFNPVLIHVIARRTTVMGGPKGADRSANLGEVSTGATEGSEARSEPRVARDA